MRLEHQAGEDLTWRAIQVAEIVTWSKKTAEVIAPVAATLGELADFTEFEMSKHPGVGRQVLRQVVATIRMAINGDAVTAGAQRTLLQLAREPTPAP